MSLTLQQLVKLGEEYRVTILCDDYSEHYYLAWCPSMQLLRDFIRRLHVLDIKLVTKVEYIKRYSCFSIKFYYYVR